MKIMLHRDSIQSPIPIPPFRFRPSARIKAISGFGLYSEDPKAVRTASYLAKCSNLPLAGFVTDWEVVDADKLSVGGREPFRTQYYVFVY